MSQLIELIKENNLDLVEVSTKFDQSFNMIRVKYWMKDNPQINIEQCVSPSRFYELYRMGVKNG
jgi:hypothetical protein